MSINSAPFEIIAAPFTLWVAPVGTTFPLIDAEPGGSWTKVGSSGARNYTEDGVTIQHNQSVELWRGAGSPGPRKAFRTEEELHVMLTLADITLEQYGLALNHNTVTTVPAGGEAGYKKIGLSRGLGVVQRALLVRGAVSPYGEGEVADWNTQYEIPIAVQISEPEVVFSKGGDAAGLALEWVALEDDEAESDDERFGRLVAQNEDPVS